MGETAAGKERELRLGNSMCGLSKTNQHLSVLRPENKQRRKQRRGVCRTAQQRARPGDRHPASIHTPTPTQTPTPINKFINITQTNRQRVRLPLERVAVVLLHELPWRVLPFLDVRQDSVLSLGNQCKHNHYFQIVNRMVIK